MKFFSTALFLVIPAQAGIQIGCFTAKTPRRQEKLKAALGGNKSRAAALVAPWRLGVLAVDPTSLPNTPPAPWTPAYAGVT